MNGRLLVPAALLAAAVAWPAAVSAQPVEPGRGNIVSIDKNAQTVELKDPKGRVRTWKYDRNATVKFTDGSSFFPNPSTNDLRPPMYVHFNAQNEVIESFDVVELGFQPGNEASASGVKTPGTPRTVTGNVTAYDPNVKQVELDVNGRRETFQLTDSTNQQFNPGDRVQLKTGWSSATELVTQAQVLSRSGSTGNTGASIGGATNRRGGVLRSRSGNQAQSGNSTQGRVVSINPDGVVMQVAGSQQTYAVSNTQLLQRLRVGDTVTFDWRTDNNGRMYITNVR